MPLSGLGAKLRAALRDGLPAGGGNPAGPGFVEDTSFGPNPGNLRLLRLLPGGTPAGAPLIVLLHGCTQTAAGLAVASGWLEVAHRAGAALLLPEQRADNNPQRCFNWFNPVDVAREGGEVASIRQMVAHLVAAHRLDARRVFVAGLSAGGAMTAALLAACPGVFAAGAVFAGLPVGAAATVPEALAAMRDANAATARDWPAAARAAAPAGNATWPALSIWHGAADAVVHPANGAALAAQWAGLHGLRGLPERDGGTTMFERRRWRGQDGRVLVELNTIAGMGHGVPIGEGSGAAAPFVLDVGVAAARRAAAFFGLMPETAAAAGTAAAAAPEDPGEALRRVLAAAGLWKR